MSPGKSIRAKIGRRDLEVPICDDRETTQKIIQMVNDRLQEIEDKSERIDTMDFALQTAVSFAADLTQARKAHAEDEKELLLALDALSQHLRDMITNATQEDDDDQ